MLEIKVCIERDPYMAALCSSGTIQERLDSFMAAVCSDRDTMVESLQAAIVKTLGGTTNAERPFAGQPHTMQGDRGRNEVSGLNFRDISDCLVRAMAWSANDQLTEEAIARIDKDQFTYQELFDINFNDTDPVAIIQNLCVEIEKRMGIYPNVPQLHPSNPEVPNERSV